MYYKILKKLYLFIREELKKEHLKIRHNDIKCPYCNEWFSISEIRFKHKIYDKNKENPEVVTCTCGQCKFTSYWNTAIAPVLVRCNKDGWPVTTLKEKYKK